VGGEEAVSSETESDGGEFLNIEIFGRTVPFNKDSIQEHFGMEFEATVWSQIKTQIITGFIDLESSVEELVQSKQVNEVPPASEVENEPISAVDMSGSCVVCLTAVASHVVVPCGHQCLCADCALHVTNKCPYCRGRWEKCIKVFIPSPFIASSSEEAPSLNESCSHLLSLLLFHLPLLW
jgi:hypothetical protein